MKTVLRAACASGLLLAAFGGIGRAADAPAPVSYLSDWDFYFGGLYLQRSRPDSAVVATPPTGTPGVLINADDFVFGWDPGFELAATKHFSNGWSLQGRYFSDNDASGTFGIPAVTTFRVAGIGVTILGGGSINGFASSDLQNAELNVAAPITPGLSALAGFRWISLNDQIRLNIATPNTFTQWSESNNLYGVQLGLNLALQSPGLPLDFNAGLKAGAFANSASNAFRSNIVGSTSSAASLTSYGVEANLDATYHLTPNLSLRAGYMALWLGNVALAGPTAQTTVQGGGGTQSPVGAGDLWYQGLTFGLDLALGDGAPAAPRAAYAAAAAPRPSDWDFYLGGMYLQRSRPDSSVIATPPTGTPGVLINASDFVFGWDAGLELSAARHFANGWSLEGRYFSDNDASATFGIPSVTTFRTAGIGVTILGGGSINGFASSDLQNAELNVAAPITPGLSALAGFRWISLNDQIRLNIATPNTFTQWSESNNLYGAQIGLNLALESPGLPLDFDAGVKAGVFANSASNAFRSNIVSSTSATASLTSYAVEANLDATYHLTSNLSLRAGYMALWLGNVALAGPTAQTTVQGGGGTESPVSAGNLWYQGATFGAELNF